MRTTVLLLAGGIAGIAVGAVAVHVGRLGDAPGADGGTPAAADDARPGPRKAATAPAADGSSLAALIRAAAAEPPSGRRTVRIAALLLRYAETDPAGAARLGRSVRADAGVMRLLFAAWAENDPDGALAELESLDNPADAREIALALLRSQGIDERSAARLAALLPPAERRAFLAEAVAARAATAPLAAMRQALAIEDAAARDAALTRLAPIWARLDPRQALLESSQIADDRERESFRDAVLLEWGRSEPEAAFEQGILLGRRSMDHILLLLAQQLPDDRVGDALARAADVEGEEGISLRRNLVQRLAQNDPAAAAAELDRLPVHEQPDLRRMIAVPYGAKEPERALAWAQSIEPRDPELPMSVLRGLAQTDPERAVTLAASLPYAADREQAIAMVTTFAAHDDQSAERMANRLLSLDDAGLGQRTLIAFVGSWAARAPEPAFAWLAANDGRVPAEAFQNVAVSLAFRDPELAASYTARVPAGARPQWIAAVANGYAQRDPEGALGWLAQYRGDPAYRAAVMPVAATLARRDGAAAVRLLEETGALDADNPTVALNVVMGWSQQDPAAAAAWAAGLEDPRLRSAALGMTMQQWSVHDAEAARRWAFALPGGSARDEALLGLLSTPYASGALDEEVFAALGSEIARNRAVIQTAMRMAVAGERDRARTLLEQRVSDPVERSRALGALEQLRIGPGAMVVSPLGTPAVGFGLPPGLAIPPPANRRIVE